MSGKLDYGFTSISYDGIDNITPSVVMGNGSVRVTTIANDDDVVTGISLCDSPSNRPVGEKYIVDGVSKDPDEDPLYTHKNAKFQMLFDNPKSIDVVIARLVEAKSELIKIQGGVL